MSLSSAGLPHRSYASEDSEPLPGHAAPELHSARVLMGGSMNGAPMLVGATPADNSGQVTVGSNIVLTFNTAMAAGTGNIVISDGYLQSYIDKAGHTQTRWVGVTDSHVVNVSDSQVTISGDTVTIDLTGNLKPGVSYNVTMAAGVLKDSGNHPFAGLLDSSKLNFATDSGIVTQVSAVALSTDTGSSASDFYTSAVHQTISGSINTLPAGGKVKVSIDGGATFVDAAVNSANHTWSLNTDLQDGTQQLVVHVTDASTQVIATYSHNYTLDTHAASQSLATVTPGLNADDDSSGASNSDNITNVAQPHVTVHIGDAYQLHSGDVVQIVDSNHGNAIVGSYTLLANDIASYGGNFSIQLDHALSDGEHDLKVQIGDLAGFHAQVLDVGAVGKREGGAGAQVDRFIEGQHDGGIG